MRQPELAPPDAAAERRRRLQTTAIYFAVFGALGLTYSVLGPTLPALAERTGATWGAIGILFTARSLGFLVGSLQSGRMYDRWPGHPILIATLAAMAILLAVVPFVPLLWLLAGVMLVLGMVQGTVDVGGNTLLVWVHGREVGPYMAALHAFSSVGALLMSLIAAWMIALTGDAAWTYLVLAGLVLVPAAALLRAPASPVAPAPARASARPAQRAQVLLMSAFFLFVVGAEQGFVGWVFSYATELGVGTASQAAQLTIAFFAAYTAGRLLAIPFSARVRPLWMLAAGLAAGMACLVLMLAVPPTQQGLLLITIGVGLSMSPIFPTAISFAERRIDITGKVTSSFLAGASVGVMAIPFLIGQLFDVAGPQALPYVILAALLAAAGVLGILVHGT